jgi:hypothetical protein
MLEPPPGDPATATATLPLRPAGMGTTVGGCTAGVGCDGRGARLAGASEPARQEAPTWRPRLPPAGAPIGTLRACVSAGDRGSAPGFGTRIGSGLAHVVCRCSCLGS